MLLVYILLRENKGNWLGKVVFIFCWFSKLFKFLKVWVKNCYLLKLFVNIRGIGLDFKWLVKCLWSMVNWEWCFSFFNFLWVFIILIGFFFVCSFIICMFLGCCFFWLILKVFCLCILKWVSMVLLYYLLVFWIVGDGISLKVLLVYMLWMLCFMVCFEGCVFIFWSSIMLVFDFVRNWLIWW